MTIPAKVKSYLDKSGIDYEAIAHRTVFTAYDAAQTLKKKLSEVAKNLLIEADKVHVLVILPADKKVDLEKLKKALGVKKVSIAKEQAMIKVLKIKPGSLSSFGKLHKLEVLVDKAMAGTQKILFSTGSFTDSVLMKAKDFIQMEEAKLANIAVNAGYKIPKKVQKQIKKVKTAAKKKPAKKPAVKQAIKKIVKKVAPKSIRPAAKKKVTKRKTVSKRK
jgi:prolyl-tRNA editing enzyme YbaK/EbsC (Cys-tRNA(Pro) deacylase)